MKRYAILLILVIVALFASPISGQQHALTAAQCVADAAAWGPSGSSGWLNNLDLSKPNPGGFGVASSDAATVDEINRRIQEMTECSKIDRLDLRTHNDVEMFYLYITWQRMHDFLLRHNLREQFLQEDREGKR